MDTPVLTDIPLTVRAPSLLGSGTGEAIVTCALSDRTFLVSAVPDVLQVMVVASEDIVEIVQTFDTLPEKNVFTGQRKDSELQTYTDTTLAGIGERATKMLFANTENLVFVLVGGCLRCFGFDPKRDNCFPAVILVDQDVIDFDISFCNQLGLLVAALYEGNIIQTWTVRGGLFLNLSEGELPTEDSDTTFTKIQFVASPVVCAFDDTPMARTGYSIISVDTLTAIGHIAVTPTPSARLMVTPLFDALERANVVDASYSPKERMETMANFASSGRYDSFDERWAASHCVHSNKFAVLAFNPRQVLEFRLELYQLDPSFGMRHLMMIPLVCVAHPTMLSSLGPWLCISLPYGIEYYDWQNGDFAQSALDSCHVLGNSAASRVADFERLTASYVYHYPTNDIVFYSDKKDGTGEVKVSLIATLPIVEVVYGLMESGGFQGLQPTDLMTYGHDIGADAVIGGADFASRLSNLVESATSGIEMKRNALFNEYGAMLGKFVHLHPQAGISTCEGCKYCSLCGSQFGFFSRGKRCALCNSPCCDDCAQKYDLRDFGFMNVDPSAPIFPCCNDCISYADQTLYLLMASKRYLQLLQYASDYPEKTCGFSFDHLLGVSLNQCFLDKRYDVTARIVIRYISTPEQLQEWIARFAAEKQLHMLANVFDPRKNDSSIVTTIMMGIMKSDPTRLRALVRKWPAYCYDVGIVSVGIEQQLRKRRTECELLQEQCETTAQSEDDRRTAAGLLYIDADTTQLLLALLHIYGLNEEHTNVVRAYIEHFDQFQMTKDERKTRRPRADAVFVANETSEAEDLAEEAGKVLFDVDCLSDGEPFESPIGGMSPLSPSPKDLKSPRTAMSSSGRSAIGSGSSALLSSSQRMRSNTTKPHAPSSRRLKFKQWGSQRCEENYTKAAAARKPKIRNPYDFQLLDVCEYINERDLYPIALAPYGHNNNFTVMTTMLRLHADEVSDFLATIDSETCQSMLDVVIQHLTTRPKEQLYLLHALSQRNLMLTVNYHDRLADLYIDHMPETFLWFVKQKSVTSVDWRRVLLRVQQRRMYAEMVYVVGRIGNDKDAIRIALRNLKSVHFAMKYVSDGASLDDQDSLWKELMSHVIQNSTLIGDCMDHIAEYRNPAEFIAMIPKKNRVVIPNVGQRLGAICREQSINKSIEDSCLDLFRRDNMEALKRSVFAKRRAIRVGGAEDAVGSYKRCGICAQYMCVTDAAAVTNAIVFAACGHAFHPTCLSARYDVTKQAEPVRIKLVDDDIAAQQLALRQATRQRTFTMSPASPLPMMGGAGGEEEEESPEEAAVRKATRTRAAKRAMANYKVLREQEDSRDIVQLLPNHLLVWILSYVPLTTRHSMRGVADHWRETIDVAKQQLAAVADVPLDPNTKDLFLKAKYYKSRRDVPSYRNTVTSATIELGTALYVPNKDSQFAHAGCALCESAMLHSNTAATVNKAAILPPGASSPTAVLLPT